MAIQNVAPFFMPSTGIMDGLASGTVSFQSLLLSAAAHKAAMVFRVPKAGNLARIGFRTGTVTTGDTLRISFQDVSAADGNPDGVVDQFRTQAVADTDDNVWFRTGLITSDGTDSGTKRAVNRGDLLSVVIDFNAYVAGNLNIAINATTVNGVQAGAYMTLFTAAWAKQAAAASDFAVEYDDGTFSYIPGTFPCDTKTTTNFNSGSTPDEVALKFRVPIPVRASGFWVSTTATGDFDVVLYDSDGTTALATVSLDKDQVLATATTGIVGVPFASSITLLKNTFYRLSLRPGASNVARLDFTVNASPGAAILDQMLAGQDFHYSQRTDAGAWSDTTTKRPMIGLIVDGLDDGAGGMRLAGDGGLAV